MIRSYYHGRGVNPDISIYHIWNRIYELTRAEHNRKYFDNDNSFYYCMTTYNNLLKDKRKNFQQRGW